MLVYFSLPPALSLCDTCARVKLQLLLNKSGLFICYDYK